ncbi:putative AC9 transposase [Bienertia sinuspersici]
MMEPVLCPGTLEVNMDWDRKARRGAAVADKLNYTKYGLRKKVIALDTPTRWNSTYKLLHDAIAYHDVLTDMYNESWATNGQFITNDHWSLAKIVHDVLETFDNATHIFSYVYEPNIHMEILECIKIICTIKKTSLANPGAAVKRLLDNMKVKWCAYFTEFPPIYAIAAILDPGVKLEVLARIAKDILAIPASTIASESAFSAGRRVLDEKRSHLSSESIKMCVCKNDCDQAKKRTQGLKEEEEDEDDPWMTLDSSDSGGSGDGGNQQQQQAP